MDNPEKMENIAYTERGKTKQKHNPICVEHHYMQTNTNNVYKTWVILQITGGKDESNIVFMSKSKRASQHGT